MTAEAFLVQPLNRGGSVVRWRDLHLQVGAYPETIKDTMASHWGVPQTFIVPERLFDHALGVSAAELEFPIYFNFYLKQRQLRFICRSRQLRPLLRVLREAIFGPRHLDYAGEYAGGAANPVFPDLAKEMLWYKRDPARPRGRLLLRDVVRPLVFDEQGRVEIDGYVVEDLGQDRYRLHHQGQIQEFEHTSPGRIRFAEPPVAQRFTPPNFGMTVIGSGHGFDVKSDTSGFILWINQKGILVDPPVHATEWLRHQNIDGRLVEDIILTHCHADHDAGTLQKILQESRVTIHTTPTVLNSFVSKYRSLTNLSGQQFRQLFDQRPIPVGQPVNIAGAEFTFKYMLHPIPTLGFSLQFQGRSVAYSCDTLYDPEAIRCLSRDGILSPARAQDLLDFPFDSDLVLHEAGIPPIHTPMAVLAALPPKLKANLYLTHVSASAIEPESGLRLAPPGVVNTLTLEVEPPDVSHAQQVLDALRHLDLFQSLGIARAAEFLRIASYSQVEAGSYLVREGQPGETFHIILSGEATIEREGTVLKRVGRYDYIGEIALVLDRPRTANVLATTAVECISIKRQDFLDFIRGTNIPELFRRVSQNKLEGSWEVFQHNLLLDSLSTFQKTQLLATMERFPVAAEQWLFQEGEVVEAFWLIVQGQVQVGEQTWERGAWLGRVNEDLTQVVHPSGARALDQVLAYRMPMTPLKGFFLANPGLLVRVLGQQSDRPSGVIL